LQQGRLVKDIKLSDYQGEIFILDANAAVQEIVEKFPQMEVRHKAWIKNKLRLEILATTEQFQEFLVQCQNNKIEIERFKSKSLLEDLFHRYVNE
jgi:hypothetical protein